MGVGAVKVSEYIFVSRPTPLPGHREGHGVRFNFKTKRSGNPQVSITQGLEG